MGNSTRSTLDKLRSLSPQLNKTSDDVAAIVAEVEKILVAEIPIPGSVTMWRRNISSKMEEVTSLEFDRFGGKFRIAIVTARCREFTSDLGDTKFAWENTDEIPFLQASRDQKLEAFPFMGKLLEKILANASKAIEEASAAVPAIEKILQELSAK